MFSKVKNISFAIGLTCTAVSGSLFCEENSLFSLSTMEVNEQECTGINKLTSEEQTALENWMQQQLLFADDEDTEEGSQEPQEVIPDAIALAENTQTQPTDTLSQSEQTSIPRMVAIQEIKEDGKFIVLENGKIYRIPTMLRRKSNSWKAGDVVTVDPTKKSEWFRLRSTRTNEHVLGKIEPPSQVPEQK